MPITGFLKRFKRYCRPDPRNSRAPGIRSFELFGDFVEPSLDARLVDAGRAGHADPGFAAPSHREAALPRGARLPWRDRILRRSGVP